MEGEKEGIRPADLGRTELTEMLDALIIDSNPLSRGFLWQATLAESHFRQVKAVSTLTVALTQLDDRVFDVILIPSNAPIDEVKQFVTDAKQKNGGKEAAYIVVLKVPDQTTEKIAAGIMDGTDGFLFEPFSVDSLKQVAAVASRIKGEHERRRKEAAMKLVIGDLIKALDEYSAAVSNDKGAFQNSRERKAFHKASATLKKFRGNDVGIYLDLAPPMFEAAPPRIKFYKGASRRLQKKLNN